MTSKAADRIHRHTGEDNVTTHIARSTVALCTPAYVVGNPMGGVGVRVWELALALASSVDVCIIARGPFDLAAPGVSFVDAGDEIAMRAAVDRAAAVVFYDLPDSREMLRVYHDRDALIISEISPPIEHLEYHAIRSAPDADVVYAELVARYELQVLLTDHFLVQSNVARATLIASLCHLGRLTRDAYDESATLEHLMTPLPLGFSRAADATMRRAAATMPVVDFAWSGGIWDYYDPVALLRAVAALKRKQRRVTVRFLYPAPADQVLTEARELIKAIALYGLDDCVQFSAPPPHAHRDGALLSSNALVCIAKPGIENATCVRLRLRDTLLYVLPLVVDPFGATATEVRASGIGIVADPRDVNELAEALDAVAHDDQLRRTLVERVREARERFVIDDCVPTLLDVIRRGRRANDRNNKARGGRVEELLSRHPSLWKAPAQPW